MPLLSPVTIMRIEVTESFWIPLRHLRLDVFDDPLRVVEVCVDVAYRRDGHATHRDAQLREPAKLVDDFLGAHAGTLGGVVHDHVCFTDLRAAKAVKHFERAPVVSRLGFDEVELRGNVFRFGQPREPSGGVSSRTP